MAFGQKWKDSNFVSKLESFYGGGLGICLHFFSLAGDAKRNQGVDQCLHWSTHMPPACADKIQIPNPE
jgi:hypothetical protein